MKDLENILKSIKNKELQPIYFFHGEESYFMDVAVDALENEVLTEDEKAFNQTVTYGKDTTYDEVLALARQFPMMGDKQVIIVKEAQNLKLTKEAEEKLLKYIENPVPSTLLVFAHKYKKLDGRKKFAGLLKKKNWLHYSEPVKDYHLAKWIQGQMQQMKIKATPDIPHLLAEYLGNDLSRIHNELKKLKLVLKPGEEVNGKLIELHVGISKDYNVFELQKALGAKNETLAMKIAFYMGRNMKNNPMPLVIGTLYNYFANLILYHTMRGQAAADIARALGVHPYFMKEYEQASRIYPLKEATKVISILREFDLKSKGLGAQNVPDEELLTACIYKILHIKTIKVKL